MQFPENVKPWGIGSNSLLELVEHGAEQSYSLIDDLLITGSDIDMTTKDVTLECSAPKFNQTVTLTFKGVKEAKVAPANTFERYNTHDQTTDLSIIDQIIYDPEHQESETAITIVGLGWTLSLEAEKLSVITVPD